jgi:hypothetical protein
MQDTHSIRVLIGNQQVSLVLTRTFPGNAMSRAAD